MAISFKPITKTRMTRYVVKASETIAVGDPVEIDADGLLICATATSAALAGVAAEAVSSAASGAVIMVYDDPKAIFLAKCDNVAENLQAVVGGDDFDLVGTTGAFYVNLGATAVNVFRVRAIGPHYDPQLAASSATKFSFRDGTELLVEIKLHALASA